MKVKESKTKGAKKIKENVKGRERKCKNKGKGKVLKPTNGSEKRHTKAERKNKKTVKRNK